MPGYLEEPALNRVFNAWRRAIRQDPLLARVAMPELRPLAETFNNALTGDDEGQLSEACNELVRTTLEPATVTRLATILAETFTDEIGNQSGAVVKSLVGTLGFVCGLMITTMVGDVTVLAYRDSLTGLESQRAWEAALAESAQTAARITVAIIDMNGLKAINDSRGHEAGNEYLRQFAADLRDAVPEPGRVYRFGGDEYAVLCRDIGAEDVGHYLRKLAEEAHGASFSFGVADTSEDGPDVRMLVQLADERMYAMKKEYKARTAQQTGTTTPDPG